NHGINSEALVVLTTVARTSNPIPGSGGDYALDTDIKIMSSSEYKQNALKAIYPNPFIIGEHTVLHISFSLQETSDVKIILISSSGKVIKIIEKQNMLEGLHQYDVTWDGTNDDNLPVPSGIYLCQLRVGDYSDMKKIAVIRK
ncbi:T9SS type A sorting domain-containing protein, partial [bacterium]|nr:T9SS type A sorting domain-containing protein [bacterium]